MALPIAITNTHAVGIAQEAIIALGRVASSATSPKCGCCRSSPRRGTAT